MITGKLTNGSDSIYGDWDERGRKFMYTQRLVLGIVPVKRSFLSMREASRQKNHFMKTIREHKPALVDIVDIDDIAENGILYEMDKVPAVVGKLRRASIDALFIPFCDFGEEQVAAAIASVFRVPVLIWGARDERPNTFEERGRDTQCGMFAATKVLQTLGITYSYILNCETESSRFKKGFDTFIRAAAVVKAVKGLRIAKIGERPAAFMSVMANETGMAEKFGMVCVPISPTSVVERMNHIIEGNSAGFKACCCDIMKKMDCSDTKEEDLRKVAAIKIAVRQLMEENICSVGAFECWSAFPALVDICPCLVLGELADEGLPLACEADINGAVTLALLRACSLYGDAQFLADLTIRNPQNDNSELLWHCGPFPYSLKNPESRARLVAGQESFEMKQGDLTVCRFDQLDGKFYLFAGEARTTYGPETTGTYVWMETDNWQRWEEKLMFGPYIHHLGVCYGRYLPVLREAARYLGLQFDSAHEQGIHSL